MQAKRSFLAKISKARDAFSQVAIIVGFAVSGTVILYFATFFWWAIIDCHPFGVVLPSLYYWIPLSIFIEFIASLVFCHASWKLLSKCFSSEVLERKATYFKRVVLTGSFMVVLLAPHSMFFYIILDFCSSFRPSRMLLVVSDVLGVSVHVLYFTIGYVPLLLLLGSIGVAVSRHEKKVILRDGTALFTTAAMVARDYPRVRRRFLKAGAGYLVLSAGLLVIILTLKVTESGDMLLERFIRSFFSLFGIYDVIFFVIVPPVPLVGVVSFIAWERQFFFNAARLFLTLALLEDTDIQDISDLNRLEELVDQLPGIYDLVLGHVLGKGVIPPQMKNLKAVSSCHDDRTHPDMDATKFSQFLKKHQSLRMFLGFLQGMGIIIFFGSFFFIISRKEAPLRFGSAFQALLTSPDITASFLTWALLTGIVVGMLRKYEAS